MNKGNRDIKSDKNDRWTWKMDTDQKIFQNFFPLPENKLLKIFFQIFLLAQKMRLEILGGPLGSDLEFKVI